MGLCEFCGTQAGFMRRSHRACLNLYEQGVSRIAAVVADHGLSVEDAGTQIRDLAMQHRVQGENLTEALEDAWAKCIKAELRLGNFTQAKELRLDSLLGAYGLMEVKKERRRLWAQVLKHRRETAREIIEGQIQEGIELAKVKFSSSSCSQPTLDKVEEEIRRAAADSNMAEEDFNSLIAQSVECELERFLEDGRLTHAEEHAVKDLSERLDIRSDPLDEDSLWAKMSKFSALRDLAEGRLPDRFAGLHVPFRLMKSETLIWVFESVDYGVIKTRREFRGGSTGVSVRVARGIYLRQGAFKGRQVEVEEPVHVDTGLLGITTKHIYFAGPSRSFRIRHSKVVSLTPFSDGLGLTRDTATAKPETFRVKDGWFLYNLLQNIEVE